MGDLRGDGLFATGPPLLSSISWKFIYYDYCFKRDVDFKNNLFSYAIKHSVGYYNNTMSGIVASKVNNISNSLENINDTLFSVLSGIIVFIILLIVYFNINIYLFIFLLFWSIIFCISQYILSKFVYKNGKKLTEQNNKTSGIITDVFSNILNLKSFANKKLEKSKVKKQGIKIMKSTSDLMKAKSIINTTTYFLVIILFLFVLGFSLNLVYNKEISIGTFLFITQNITLTSFLIRSILKNSIDLTSAVSEAKEGFDTLLQPIEIKDKDDAKNLNCSNGKIVFKNVNFAYKK